jgi:hypothetical protein
MPASAASLSDIAGLAGGRRIAHPGGAEASSTSRGVAANGPGGMRNASPAMSESDAADAGIEIRCERREEHRIIQQHIHPTQLGRQHQQLGRQERVPQRWLVVYSSEHDGLDPF